MIKIFLLVFSAFVFMPVLAYSGEAVITDEIENKLLNRDIDGAKALINDVKYNNPLKLQTESVISCVEDILNFYTWLNQKKDIPAAISAYAPMMTDCNDLPDPIPFSEKLAKAINTALDEAGKFIKKECGSDYGEIRVGMKLSRVQKCVGEFYLHGQMGWKGGHVDYYTRGDTYLYVQKGRIVSWGE